MTFRTVSWWNLWSIWKKTMEFWRGEGKTLSWEFFWSLDGETKDGRDTLRSRTWGLVMALQLLDVCQRWAKKHLQLKETHSVYLRTLGPALRVCRSPFFVEGGPSFSLQSNEIPSDADEAETWWDGVNQLDVYGSHRLPPGTSILQPTCDSAWSLTWFGMLLKPFQWPQRAGNWWQLVTGALLALRLPALLKASGLKWKTKAVWQICILYSRISDDLEGLSPPLSKTV